MIAEGVDAAWMESDKQKRTTSYAAQKWQVFRVFRPEATAKDLHYLRICIKSVSLSATGLIWDQLDSCMCRCGLVRTQRLHSPP